VLKSNGINKNEFLSTYAEIHSFIIGIAHGLAIICKIKDLERINMWNDEVKGEYHYSCGGFILGHIIEYILVSIFIGMIFKELGGLL